MARHPLNFRGGHATRLEALTDTVFGLAITLLALSADVPDSFDGLMSLMNGLVPFAASFAIIIMVWVYHYRFFKHYDLDDGYTIFLNSILLFVILFYVYPLKFMFRTAFQFGSTGGGVLSWEELQLLYTIYGIGYAAVFLVFALLYRHVIGRREMLQLTGAEVVDARGGVAACVVMILVGLASVMLALALPDGYWMILPGPFYAVIGPLQWVVGRHYGKLKETAAVAVETAGAATLSGAR